MSEDRSIPQGLDRHVIDDVVAQAETYRVMVENSIDVIIRYNADRFRVYVSPSCFEVLGFTPEEMVGLYASTRIHPDDFSRIDPEFKKVGPALPILRLTFRVTRKDGRFIWVEGHYRYLPQDGGSVAVLRDITARKQAEELLAEANQKLEAANALLRTLAQQDGLTGLANRRRFDEVLEEEFRRARRQELSLGVVLIDVDCFKAFNDRYGHLEGDECLRRISRVIADTLLRPGDIAARFGGEEFVVLLPAADSSGTLAVAEHIRCAVAALRIEHLGSPHRIATVSIGTSSVIPSYTDDTPAGLLNAADRALYQAKSDGRNRVQQGSLGPFVVHQHQTAIEVAE